MKRICCAVVVLLTVSATSLSFGLTNPITTGSITITLSSFAVIPSRLGAPQDLVSANDGTGRLFVTTRNGDIEILSSSGALSPTSFLNLASAGISLYTGGEGGFSGLAFSPTYSTDGKFYTFDTEPYNSSTPADIGFSSPEFSAYNQHGAEQPDSDSPMVRLVQLKFVKPYFPRSFANQSSAR